MRLSRRRGDRGSVLMLLPAAVLVLFVLAAISVDSAVMFTQQRQLVAAAGDVANDAADALARRAVYEGGAVQLDPSEIDRTVAEVLRRDDVRAQATWSLQGRRITVRLTRRVHLIFSGTIPGVSSVRSIHATVAALAVLSP